MEVEKSVYYTNIHTFIEYLSECKKKSALKFANSISCCCSQLIDQLKCLLRTTFIYNHILPLSVQILGITV